ncbi:MAG: DJ-1/PfpI family protein [Oleiphilaceae bacterium]|nr:DJ-1/PfpI family protein [Oleiphilaceae bacterium]
MHIGIYIYPQAEVLDFAGPFEVFTTASRLSPEGEGFEVSLIAQKAPTVVARGGFEVSPHHCIDDHPPLDVLLVAGGVHQPELDNAPVLAWVKQQSEQVKLVASVCTGVFLLAEAGVVRNQRVTTHWEDMPALRERYPHLDVIAGERWIDNEKCVTSAGISAGIDMSLHLVARLKGEALARATARQMEFDW